MKYLPMYAVGLLILLGFCTGLVVDGGGQVQTLQQAMTIAQSAARAGTNAATGSSVNGDAFDLSSPMAVTAAQNYLAAADVAGTVTVAGDTVTVTVEMTYTPRILGSYGLPPIPVEATGSARLIGN